MNGRNILSFLSSELFLIVNTSALTSLGLAARLERSIIPCRMSCVEINVFRALIGFSGMTFSAM